MFRVRVQTIYCVIAYSVALRFLYGFIRQWELVVADIFAFKRA